MTDLEIMGAREALQQCDDADTDWTGALAMYCESALAALATARAELAKHVAIVEAAKAWRRGFGGYDQSIADVQLADAIDAAGKP